MRMRINEAGGRGLAVQINHARLRPDQRSNITVRAHGKDASLAHGDGLRHRVGIIDR